MLTCLQQLFTSYIGSINVDQGFFLFESMHLYFNFNQFLKYFRLSRSITDTFMKSRMLLKQSIFSTKIFVSWPYLLTNTQSVIKRSSQIKLDILVNSILLK